MKSFQASQSRSIAWIELRDIFKNSKIIDNLLKSDDLEEKQIMLKNLLVNYRGILKANGFDNNKIFNNKSYKLLKGVCNMPNKNVIKKTYILGLENLYFHASKKANNCTSY